DSTSFVIQGGMIQFYERDNKIRLLMDPETIDETGIKVSANLMRVVKVIEKDR
ncbi:MAG: YfiR family protein, partial [Candidatus Marithrix sp.]|nr:YfiR family protein [Candidatus Marithrix sp.]